MEIQDLHEKATQLQGQAKGTLPTDLIPKTDQERIQKAFAIRNRFGHYWGITHSDSSGQTFGWTDVLSRASIGKTAKSRTTRIEQLMSISKLTGVELFNATCKFNIMLTITSLNDTYQSYKSSGYENYMDPLNYIHDAEVVDVTDQWVFREKKPKAEKGKFFTAFSDTYGFLYLKREYTPRFSSNIRLDSLSTTAENVQKLLDSQISYFESLLVEYQDHPIAERENWSRSLAKYKSAKVIEVKITAA